jgi:hypothetical protein
MLPETRREPIGSTMTLALPHTLFLDSERGPDDCEGPRYQSRTLGRINRLRSSGRELCQWTQIGPRAPTLS